MRQKFNESDTKIKLNHSILKVQFLRLSLCIIK